VFGLLVVLVLLGPQPKAEGQSSAIESRILQPPRAGLLAVHLPDVETLEPDVREQLSSLHRMLTTLAKDSEATDHRLAEAYGLMGQVYQAYSLMAPAEECYLNARQLAPADYRWPYLLGNVCEKSGRPKEAILYYELTHRLRPHFLAVLVNLGNLYFQHNRLDDGRASYNKALAIDKECSAAKYGLGQVALSTGRYADAVTHFEQALAETPEANRIHYALAMAYRGLGDTDKARAHLKLQGPVGVRVFDPVVDRLQELVSGERLHMIRGRVAFEAGRFSEAAEAFRKAVVAKPNSVSGRVNFGSSLAKLGDVKGAIEQYSEAVRLEPRNSDAHYNLGLLLGRENQHKRSIFHLQSALAINPSDTDARLLLARQLLKAARREEALSEFSRVVELDPGNEDALLDQVALLIAGKKYSDALRSLERGHRMSPDRGRTAIMLAYLLVASPELDQRNGAMALELAEKAYRTTGLVNHGVIVAMALAELGRCNEAADRQRRLIAAVEQRQPKDPLLEKLRADLERYERLRPCRPTVASFATNSPSQQ
jgi:tetratricopeptide (TPR) repeat protein